MTVLLLANVGNHDLRLDAEGQKLLPEQADVRFYHSPRRLGEEVAANFNRYREHVKAQLLAPTLEWLLDHENVDPADLTIHLFASNQHPDLTPEKEWLKDTYPAAEVIQSYVNWRWNIPKRAVALHAIEGIPADYTNTLAFFQRNLPPIQARVKPDRVYMEVSGGTPAMTSMLILMGVEVFGQEIVTLYLDREGGAPYQIGVAQALFARKARETLQQQIQLYSYAVALDTLKQNGRRLHPDERKRDLLRELLSYADRRLAFDYDAARLHLREARALAVGNLQALIGRWQAELNAKQNTTVLAELIHSATIKLHLGDYADFTQRLFRFQEAIFRHMAEQMGIEYGKKDTQYLSQSWLEAQPALVAYLERYARGASGKPLVDKVLFVDTKRSLNRFNLGAIVDYYVQQPEWTHWQNAAESNFAFSAVADLRNKGVAGHGFEGISRQDLEDAYGQPADAILESMAAIYDLVLDKMPGENPYNILNREVETLLKDAS